MKRLLTAAMILSLAGGSAAMTQPGHSAGQPGKHDSRQDNRDNRQGELHDNGKAVHYDNRDNHAGNHDNGLHRGQNTKWVRGQRLPAEYRAGGYQVDYRRHQLSAPPRGYRWVRVKDDYMMIAPATGRIASIIKAKD